MLVFAAVFAASMAHAAPTDTWALEHVYPTVEAFEAAREDVASRIDRLNDGHGKLGESASTLADQLELQFAVRQDLARLWTYASNHSNADTRADDWQQRKASVGLLDTRLSEATAWVDPELLEVGSETIEAWIAEEPRLAPYAYPLRATLRRAEHTLSPAEERLLALTGDVAAAPGDTYSLFVAAELPWPTMTIEGEEVTLRPAAYALHRRNPDRAVRREVYDTFFNTYGRFEGTLGSLLTTQLQQHWFTAQARGYESSVEAAIAHDFVPRVTYDTLVEQTNENLSVLHRYFKLRGKLTGIEDLGYHDLYVPLVQSSATYDLATSKELAWRSAKPLGKPYVKALRAGLDAGWIDAYPREGKVSGAYMDGAAYGVHPYVLLNHNDDWEAATTLAHEMGHAMHTYLTMEAQPYPTADYATFTAEIASTFNEALLLDYMLKHAKSDDERLFYLGNALEALRTTYFRQAMFAEFELAMHEKVEAGEPVTGAALTELYGDLLRRYHGHDQGIVTITEADTHEWAYVPHFYYNYYVWQYATSIAASSLLAQRVLDKDPGAVDTYLTLLRSGGNGDPTELLKAAHVDMATPEPYQALFQRMNRIMDEIEAILERREE